MSYILVGTGTARFILSVEKVPEVGDILEVTSEMIVDSATELPYMMVGQKIKFTKRHNDFKTEKGTILPQFSFETVY